MTVLEIMVVMVILGMIASLVGVAVMDRLEEAKMKDAKIQIQTFAQALELYRLDFGSYPSTSEGLQTLVTPPKNKRPYMPSIPKDPWSNDYVFLMPGSKNANSFDIISYGPDGSDGGADDVGNWEEEN